MLHTHTVQGFYSQKKLENDNVLSFIYENDMNKPYYMYLLLHEKNYIYNESLKPGLIHFFSFL